MTFLWLPDSGLWPYYPNLQTQTHFRTLRVKTHFRATLTRNIFTLPSGGRVASNRQIHYNYPLLYELFVRERPLHSLGTLLRLDFSVCNPPVLVIKILKDPVLTSILWEKE